jgi:hypothetical protein
MSNDRGATWNKTWNDPANGTNQITGLASSSDGQLLTFYGGNPTVNTWTSQDYGATWTEHPDSGLTGDLAHNFAASADGKRLVALKNETTGATVYTSSDQGVTWAKRWSVGNAIKQGVAVASSADGHLLFISVGYGPSPVEKMDSIYTSADYGITWVAQPTTGPRDWANGGLAASADGTRFAASAPDAGVLTFQFAP